MRNTYANIDLSREIQNIQISIRCKIQDIQISRRQSIWCKIHEISSYFWDPLPGAKYPNISQIIFRVQNTHEISRYPGDHLSGAGNWRSQEANGGPLPQASRAKPSFTGFPDSSQTYLLAFVMPLISEYDSDLESSELGRKWTY